MIIQIERLKQWEERIHEIREGIEESLDPDIIELGGNGRIGIYPKKFMDPGKESYEKDMLSTINTAKKIAQELKIELSKNPELMKSREDVFVFADEEEKVEIHIGLLGMHPFFAKSAVPFVINQLRHLL